MLCSRSKKFTQMYICNFWLVSRWCWILHDNIAFYLVSSSGCNLAFKIEIDKYRISKSHWGDKAEIQNQRYLEALIVFLWHAVLHLEGWGEQLKWQWVCNNKWYHIKLNYFLLNLSKKNLELRGNILNYLCRLVY